MWSLAADLWVNTMGLYSWGRIVPHLTRWDDLVDFTWNDPIRLLQNPIDIYRCHWEWEELALVWQQFQAFFPRFPWRPGLGWECEVILPGVPSPSSRRELSLACRPGRNPFLLSKCRIPYLFPTVLPMFHGDPESGRWNCTIETKKRCHWWKIEEK